jgi:acyl-CoA thioester hydrolase
MDVSSQLPQLLAGFPVVFSLPVQWGDQDAFGHVNNTIYFRWFESARIAYFERIGLNHLLEHEPIGPILASMSCDYRRQITYPDTVDIGMRVSRIGRTSIGMEHAVASRRHGAIAADGKSTIVVYDYRAKKSEPVPESVRRAIEVLEGRAIH